MIREALTGPLQRSDVTLWAAVAVLASVGFVSVYSATLAEPPHPLLTPAALRHALIAVAGVGAMIFAARFDYRLLQQGSAALYLLAVALLLFAAVAGETEYGARRWLTVGDATFQPSELAKLALVLALASYASVRTPRLPALLFSLLLLGTLALPVLAQPDTGTALVLIAGWLAVVLVWGAPWRTLGGLFAALAGVMVALLNNLVEPTMGAVPAYKALAIIVLGGLGSVRGTLVASLALGVIESFGTIYIGHLLDRDAIAFAFLILVLMVRPRGLLVRG